jgi:hypothetical protein
MQRYLHLGGPKRKKKEAPLPNKPRLSLKTKQRLVEALAQGERANKPPVRSFRVRARGV